MANINSARTMHLSLTSDRAALENARDISGARSIHRAFEVVRLLAGNSYQGLKLRDLATALGLPHPTVHRILKALELEGVVERAQGSRNYVVGRELIWLGMDAYWRFPFNSAVEAALTSMMKELEETVLISVRAGRDSVCVFRRAGRSAPFGTSASIGNRLPIASTPNGRTMLAFMPHQTIKMIMEESTAPGLQAELENARVRGYGHTKGLSDPDTTAISFPVYDRVGVPIAAIATVSPDLRMSDRKIARAVRLLSRFSREISDHLLRFDIERAKTRTRKPDQGFFPI